MRVKIEAKLIQKILKDWNFERHRAEKKLGFKGPSKELIEGYKLENLLRNKKQIYFRF